MVSADQKPQMGDAMRALLWAAVAAMLLGLPPTTAQANCDVGGQDVPCETQNGHYRIRTPEGPGPHPTVVYLYGSLGNSQQKISNESFVQAFVDRGYAVIVPAALNLRYATGVGSGWYLRNEKGRKKRNDTRFVAEVLDDAEIQHNINRNRVLIAGMSRGGFLAWEIACHNPQLASAYAPVAGGYLGVMPPRCAAPVRILHTHGRGDAIVPYDPANPWSSGGAAMSPLTTSMERMAATNGCITATEPTRFREYDRTTWSGCPGASSVDLLVHKGGHTIPLSWYSTVVDWFENGIAAGKAAPANPAPAVGVGNTNTNKRPKFKSVGQKNSRFKKVKTK